MRELNDAVFDAVVGRRNGVVRVGQGAGLYGFVGKWVPTGLVAWMMGIRPAGYQGLLGGFWKSEFGGGKGRVEGQKRIESGSASPKGSDSSEGGISPDLLGGRFGTSDLQNEGLSESGYVYPQRPDGSFGNRA